MSEPVYTGGTASLDCPPQARSPWLRIYDDDEALAGGAAEHIVELAAEAIARRGRCTLALAGGDTPRPIYARLAVSPWRDRIDWPRLQILFGDERCVPPDDPRSNYAMVRETLLKHVPIPPANVHRIRGETVPARAAADYQHVLEQLFGTDGTAHNRPRTGCDLVLLGLGKDGHTASLFPGLSAVAETRRWVAAEYVPKLNMWRVSLTPVVFNAARNVTFLVAGVAKADILQTVLEGPEQPRRLPAQAVKPDDGCLRWLADVPAASGLRSLR